MKYPPKCDQCDSAIINGVYCHEPGCPNREKFWDEENEMWMDIEESTDEGWLIEWEEEEN